MDSLTDEQRNVVSGIAVRDFHISDKRQCAADLIMQMRQEKLRIELEKSKNTDDADKINELLSMYKQSKKGNS